MEDGLIGKKFNLWKVIDRAEDYIHGKQRHVRYLCECSCDEKNRKVVHKHHLLKGTSKSCGCLKKRPHPNAQENLTGKKFNYLMVLEHGGYHKYPSGKTRVMWKCKCDCGEILNVLSNNLKSGKTKSCGCWKEKSITTHGMYKTRIYRCWAGMKWRCNRDDSVYHGAKGITYDPKWETFEGFLEDMGSTYEDDLEIDRIDSNGNYCKENCRWSDSKTQAFNTNKARNNKTGRTGVVTFGDDLKYYACIKIDGKQRNIPCESFEAAVRMREEYEIKEYGYTKPYEKTNLLSKEERSSLLANI